MSFTIQTAQLKTALRQLRRILPQKLAKVPQGIRFETNPDDSTLTLSAASATEQLKCRIKAEINQPIPAFHLPAVALFALVKSHSSGSFSFTPDETGEQVIVGCQLADTCLDHPLDTLPVEQWNGLPEAPRDTVPVKVPPEFFRQFRCAAESSGENASRSTLESVYIDAGNVVGCDGHELTVLAHKLPIPDEYLIPTTKFLTAADSLSGEGTLSQYSGVGKEYARITTGNADYTVEMTAGQYPNYRQVIPTPGNTEHRIRIKAETFAETCQLLETLESENPNPLGLLVCSDCIHLLNENKTQQAIRIDAESEDDFAPLLVTVDRLRLIKALKRGFPTLVVHDDKTPVQFVDGDSLTLMMPLSVNDDKLLPKLLEELRRKNAKPARIVDFPQQSGKSKQAEETEKVEETTQTKQPTPKQEKEPTMTDSKTTNPSPQSREESADPFSELLEHARELVEEARLHHASLRELATQIRTARNETKRKDRAFADARKVLDQLQKVSGF